MTVTLGYQGLVRAGGLSLVVTAGHCGWEPFPRTFDKALAKAEALWAREPARALLDGLTDSLRRIGLSSNVQALSLAWAVFAVVVSVIIWLAQDWREACAVLMAFALVRLLPLLAGYEGEGLRHAQRCMMELVSSMSPDGFGMPTPGLR